MTDTDVVFKFGRTSVEVNNLRFEPQVLGGVTIGYHFVKEGFLGYHWPKWMKYFQVAIDVSFHRLVFRVPRRPPDLNAGGKAHAADLNGEYFNGQMLTISLPIILCYGFYPNEESPFGRLIPYIGLGPAFFLSWGKASSFSVHSKNDIGLFTEVGVRYMALKKVSLDLSLRYRYPLTSFGFKGINFDSNTTHLFNAIFRVSYHI